MKAWGNDRLTVADPYSSKRYNGLAIGQHHPRSDAIPVSFSNHYRAAVVADGKSVERACPHIGAAGCFAHGRPGIILHPDGRAAKSPRFPQHHNGASSNAAKDLEWRLA